MLTTWYIPSFIALILYGAWGFFGKQAASFIDPKSALFYSSLGTLIAGMICLTLIGFKPNFTYKGFNYSLLTGLSTGLGTVFFISALRKGPVIPIVLITALYPLVTTGLCLILLSYHITTRQIIGMIFSLIAIYLLI